MQQSKKITRGFLWAATCIALLLSLTTIFIAVGATGVPATATRIEINTGNRDAVIRSDGLYYYTESTDTYTKASNANPDGYVLSGTTANTLTVEPGVTAKIYLDNVTMTSNRAYAGQEYIPSLIISKHPSCIDVSGANVQFIINGTNTITVDGHPEAPTDSRNWYACAIEKSGMDGSVSFETIDGTNESGSLTLTGTNTHEGALSSSMYRVDSGNGGFSNLTIKSGVYTVHGGQHSPGIGANCNAYHYSQANETTPQYTSNIVIEKAIVNAYGGTCCAGLGGGYGVPVDGIIIKDGAKVTAIGGKNSPGIGSGGINARPNSNHPDALNVSNIHVYGGLTEVIAKGTLNEDDEPTPGIGCGSDRISDANRPEDPNTGQPVVYERKLQDISSVPLNGGPGSENLSGDQVAWYGVVQCGTDENHLDMSVSNFVTEYDGIAQYLENKAQNNEPVSYVHIYFREAPVVQLVKSADTTGLSENSIAALANLSMQGAKYGVYTDANCTTAYKSGGTPLVLTIGADNKAVTALPPGTYYIKETTAPSRYQLNPTVYTVTAGDTGTITVPVTDPPITYTVTFKVDGNTVDTQSGIVYGAAAVDPNYQPETGYTFSGWDKPFNSITQDTVVNGTTSINKYTVTFKVDGNVIDTQTNIPYGGAATDPNYQPPQGYTFSGWDKPFNNITQNTEVNGTTELQKFTVTFKVDGQPVSTQPNIPYGGSATDPNYQPPTGYNFSGWDKPFNNITQNTVVNGTTSIKKYTVTFKVNGETIDTQNDVPHGSAATDPNYQPPTGYNFSGWDKPFNNITQDTVVNGTTEIKKFTVTFKVNDEIIDTQSNVPYGSAATDPNYQPATGYTFSGWDKPFNNITRDTVVNGTTEIKKFTVTFEVDGNLVNSQSDIPYGGSAINPNYQPPEGYTFSGWDKPFNNITQDTVVKGTTAIKKYTVTFKVDGNVIDTQSNVPHGSAATDPNYQPPTGYGFSGWDKPFNNITQDTVISGTTAINKYTVTFVVDGRTISTQPNISYGSGATDPNYQPPVGYNFSGWDKPFNNITGDTTVSGTTSIKKYTVTFVVDGQTIATQSDVPHGSAATDPGYKAPEGYTFSGWDKPFDNIVGDTVISGTTTLNKYTVTFKVDGKIIDTQTDIPYGTSAKDPNFQVPEGATFSGWDKPFDNVTQDLEITGTTTLNNVTVTFKDANGEILDVQEIPYGSDGTAPQPPEIEGKVFKGWDRTYDHVTENIVVTALYEPLVFTVTFVVDGVVIKTELVEYGKDASDPGLTDKDGYTFSGWDKTFANIKSDLTVTGHYDAIAATQIMPTGDAPIYGFLLAVITSLAAIVTRQIKRRRTS